MMGQIPPSTPGQITEVVLALAAIAAIIYLMVALAEKLKNLFAPKAAKDLYVTQEEFGTFQKSLETKLDSIRTGVAQEIAVHQNAMKGEVVSFRSELAQRLAELDKYTHESHHRASTVQQAMLIRLTRLQTLAEMHWGHNKSSEDDNINGGGVPSQG